MAGLDMLIFASSASFGLAGMTAIIILFYFLSLFDRLSKWFSIMPVKNAKGIRNDNGKKSDDQDHQYEV